MKIIGTKAELVAMWRQRADRLRERITGIPKGKRDTKRNELLRTEAWALDQCANELESWEESKGGL